ncbi:hypothetical protein [Pelagibius sp. Alg239-R121]|uniref:lipase family protein n=1 Tax=Pelagibius sp. Alg239-R121 TaxID=2993448 RepID=UPI0024A6CF9C|nr:hypothetical protein [Pelagibius sp. Alg239-R121]
MAYCLDYAKMAIASYYTNTRQYYDSPPGYMVDDWKVQKFVKGGLFGDGFQGAIFQKGKDVVVSCCGTNPDQLGKLFQDAIADIKIALGCIPSQANSAGKLIDEAKRLVGPDGRVTVTGHSLGGGLAQVCGITRNVPFVTFNAPAMRNAVTSGALGKRLKEVPGNVVVSTTGPMPGAAATGLNFALDTDLVSTHVLGRDHLGVVVEMPNVLGEKSIVGAHSPENCWQAILASDWSHIDPFEAL